MSHTPGPWRIGNLPSWDGYTGRPFRNVWVGDDDDQENGPARVIARAIEIDDVDANARLIAAAPDLLAACEDLCERAERARRILQEQSGGNWGMLDTASARDVIAAAKDGAA